MQSETKEHSIMNQRDQMTSPTNTQGRNARTRRSQSLVRTQSRALKTVHSGFASLRLCGKALLFCAVVIVLAGFSPTRAQGPEDVLRTRTRVVFLDALVKEKRTGMPISDLQLENFQVLDD